MKDTLRPSAPDQLIQWFVYKELAKGKPVDVFCLAAELLDKLLDFTLEEIASSVAERVAAANGTVVRTQAPKDRLRLAPQEEERGTVIDFQSRNPSRDH
jgi:hypothetical protein